MTNLRTPAFVMALAFFVVGCASPLPPKLVPDRQRGAEFMASKGRADASGLDWEPFPNLKNPLHAQIWKALLKKKATGDDGFGRICNYYGFYLVTVSTEDSGVQGFPSYFYFPKIRMVAEGNEQIAFSLYGGNRNATLTNVTALLRCVLAVDGFQTFIISNSTDIPHTEFTKDNPKISFNGWLLAKGIAITSPTLTKKNEQAEMSGFSEYNVFVYKPVGGQLFRYEVRCRDGQISDLRQYLIGSDIGDCWYLM